MFNIKFNTKYSFNFQVARKRLNKSFNNSSGLTQLEALARRQDGHEGHEGPDGGLADDGGLMPLQDADAAHSPAPPPAQPPAQPPDTSRGKTDNGGWQGGAKANYSLPEVDKLVDLFKLRESKSHFRLRSLNQSYAAALAAITRHRRRGAKLRAFANRKG